MKVVTIDIDLANEILQLRWISYFSCQLLSPSFRRIVTLSVRCATWDGQLKRFFL